MEGNSAEFASPGKCSFTGMTRTGKRATANAGLKLRSVAHEGTPYHLANETVAVGSLLWLFRFSTLLRRLLMSVSAYTFQLYQNYKLNCPFAIRSPLDVLNMIHSRITLSPRQHARWRLPRRTKQTAQKERKKEIKKKKKKKKKKRKIKKEKRTAPFNVIMAIMVIMMIPMITHPFCLEKGPCLGMSRAVSRPNGIIAKHFIQIYYDRQDDLSRNST